MRTYDCFISYDKHYQTPRFWLFGYDESKIPLTPTQVFQDVPADYAFKTMTMEPFPHSGQQLASVHPCKHASVMKKFIDRMDEHSGVAQAAATSSSSGGGGSTGGGSGKKGRWGLGGMVRKVTGGNVSKKEGEKEKDKERGGTGNEEEGEVKGVQVDFYLVIVSSKSLTNDMMSLYL